MTKFAEQMKYLHDDDRPRTNVEPHADWELKDYQDLHSYIKTGYLVQDDYRSAAFMINPEWEWDEDIDSPHYTDIVG